MAVGAGHPCAEVGCRQVVKGSSRCADHEKKRKRQLEALRPSRHERGYDARWVKESKAFLARNPLCAECGKKNLVVSATVVDHIIPHLGNMTLFWNQSNWQPLCKKCHDRKTALEDGRWGS